MNTMRWMIGSILLGSMMVCSSSESSAQDRNLGRIEAMTTDAAAGKGAPKKFMELLETKDFTHFRGYQTEEIPDGWEIKGKTLVFSGKGSGDVITKETFENFELQVEWSVEKGGNSGIMFRVVLGDDQPYMSGPEFQILDDANAGDGTSDLTSAGALYGLYPATNKKLNGAGKWNKSRIIVKGNSITHFLNGVKVVEAESGSDDWNERLNKSKFKDWEKFNKATEGHIAFQNHGDPVKFRNIRIKRLDAKEKEKTDKDSESGDSSESPGEFGAVDGQPAEGTPDAGAAEEPTKGRRKK